MSRLGPARGWVAVFAVAVVVTAGVTLGGTVAAEQAEAPVAPARPTGATTSVCGVGRAGTATTSVDVVAASRQGAALDDDDSLAGLPLQVDPDADPEPDPLVSLDQPGTGRTRSRLTGPLVLRGEGRLATSTAAAVHSAADEGLDRGLMLAPCGTPGTDQWLVGLGADATAESEILLANPDATQAEVDLRFFGPEDEIVVPGSPAIAVPAHDSVIVGLTSLLTSTSPVSVQVRSSRGRVSAVARDLRSTGTTPRGADWHPTSAPPARQVVVPAVAPGAGGRELRVVNPGDTRAAVAVTVLGADGEFAPTGAEQLDLAPHTTRTLELAPGLAGAGAGVRLTSDQPVTAAVLSDTATSSASDSDPDPDPEDVDDFAVAVADTPVRQQALAPTAYLPDAEATLTLSNAGRRAVAAEVSVVGLDGVVVSTDRVPVAAGASAVRTVRSSRPVFLQVRTPVGSTLYGGISFAGSDGAPGLTGMALVSPDLAARAPAVREDPAVAR